MKGNNLITITEFSSVVHFIKVKNLTSGLKCLDTREVTRNYVTAGKRE